MPAEGAETPAGIVMSRWKRPLIPGERRRGTFDQLRSRTMVEDMTTPPGRSREQLVGQRQLVVQLLVGLGLVLSMVGLVDGLRLAFKKHVAPCPNGHEFPKGTTNFNCYVHPQAGLGIGIAVLSALLGVLIVISALGVVAVFRSAEGAASA